MERYPDWQARLTSYLSERAGEPFAWGKNDCAMLPAGAVRAMTGVDLARGFRGYRTYAEGLRKARGKGFESHIAVFAAAFPAITVAEIMPGDLVEFEVDGHPAMGVAQGSAFYAVTEQGLTLLPMSDAVKGFRVCHKQ